MMKNLSFQIVACVMVLSTQLLANPKSAPKQIPNVAKVASLLLAGKEFSASEQKLFALTSLKHAKELKEALVLAKFSGDDSQYASAKRALEKVKEIGESQSASAVHGATITWYLFFQKDKISSIPMIDRVQKGSPADRAGLLPGDVVDVCAGIRLASENSRNRFAQLLAQWPESIPLELKVRRSEQAASWSSMMKRTRKTLVMFAKP
ncbi:hypothetical protein JIN77_10770 [Verrucomicrobiaceae bacterium R5-34]|nr:hypothetical protein [Verrucomicrobiaceae bacterium R5-34]